MNKENNVNEQIPSTLNPSVVLNKNTNNEDDELLKDFVGNNYEKIIKNQFNFPALFLGPIYLAYRKMYLYGVIIFIVNLIISNAIKNYIIAYSISLALFILVGIFIDKIYIKFAKRKIEKIKRENTGKSFEEIKNICVQNGKTSINSAIVFGIIVVNVSIIIKIFILLQSMIVSDI